MYDNLVNESLINKLEKVQYQACLAITGTIQSTLSESLYKELGLESPQSRRWYRKMIFFYKILNGWTPKYLFDIIPLSNGNCYNTRTQSKSELTLFYTSTKSFSNTFSPSVLKNGTSWMLKSEIYRSFPDSKNRF